MSLTSLCKSIADTLLAKVDGIEGARGPVGGRVDLAEIRRGIPTKVPAVLVVCTGTKNARFANGKVTMTGMFAAFIVVKGKPGPNGEREKAIAELAGRVVTRVAQEDWADPQVEGLPQKVDSRNLYTGSLDANDAALWVVTWEQELALTGDEPGPELDDFLSLKADWDTVGSGPEIDAQDIIKPNG
ncbi:MAG: hypothetical protein JNL82_14450 [Myxococcales bacterium]|nr:hypothetical protein [Myxococcales bacterium]